MKKLPFLSQLGTFLVPLSWAFLMPLNVQAQVTPASVEAGLPPGGSIHIEKRVQTPEIPPDPDIVFLADTTGSMVDAINNVQTNANAILAAIVAGAGGVEQFGVAQYRDFGDTPTFNVDQGLTTNQADVMTAINSWTADGGGDTPEAQLNALWELANGAVAWRPGSTRVIVWFGDASGHDPSGGHNLASVIASLTAQNIIVIAVPVSGEGDGLDAS